MKKVIVVLFMVMLFIPMWRKPMSPFKPSLIDRIENKYERGK